MGADSKQLVPQNLPRDTPLWLVYGHEAFPQLLCCKVLENSGVLYIWGLSNRKKAPKGFITLGQKVSDFLPKHYFSEWYLEQGDALQRLQELTAYPRGE